jgi:polyisoprenoid-binding protein YceI
LRTAPILALLLAAAVTPAFAAAPPFVPERDPAKILPGAYVVEPQHTRVMFGVSHKAFTTYYGQFTGASGSLTLDPKNGAAAKFDIKVPAASISTTNAVLDGELKDPPWLDVKKYPDIEFKSTSIKTTGPTTALVTGDFTFHGVTKPLTLNVKFNAAGVDPQEKKYTIGFDVTGTLKRSEFGMPVAVPLIGDEVQLIIAAAFEKAE